MSLNITNQRLGEILEELKKIVKELHEIAIYTAVAKR